MFFGAYALEEPPRDTNIETNLDNSIDVCQKVHFYTWDGKFADINNNSELAEAFNDQIKTHGNQKIKVTVGFNYNFSETETYNYYSKLRDSLKSIDEIRDFRIELNQKSKEYHHNMTEKCIGILSSLDYYDFNEISYSPYVYFYVDSDNIELSDIESLIENDDISTICFSNNDTVVNSSSNEIDERTVSNNYLTLNDVKSYLGLNIIVPVVNSGSGLSGVKIGILEAEGYCDVTNNDLVGKSIQTRGSNTSSHATLVTKVMVSLAPTADYYVYEYNNEGISSMLDENCDIINCSFAILGNYAVGGMIYKGPRCYRQDIDAVFDYQIFNHFVNVFIASGNKSTSVNVEHIPSENGDIYNYSNWYRYNPHGELASPSYTYNATTVGGVDLNNSNQLVHADGASYSSYEPLVKPEVSAMYSIYFENPFIQGADVSAGGTSFASPQVAGLSALMSHYRISYLVHPELMKNALMIGAQKTYDYTEDVSFFDEKVGAGLVNGLSMLSISDIFICNVSSDDTNRDSVIVHCPINIQESSYLKIAIVWTAVVENSNNSHYAYDVLVSDYDLLLYSDSTFTNLVYSSRLDERSNVEMISIDSSPSDFYYLLVEIYGSMADPNILDNFSLIIYY